MCLLVMAWQAHSRYRLVVAANRDEFHDRPAAALDSWMPADEILAGRDLRAGGAWLALDRRRRFGVVTNFRDLQRPDPGAPSRGELIPDFLRSGSSAEAYLAKLAPAAGSFSGFNLLLADERALWYASNRAPGFARPLPPGVYGLSNQSLDTPWPKLRRVRRRFEQWLHQSSQHTSAELLAILADPVRAQPGEELPDTGLSPEWERVLSSPFVSDPVYGTRCSTVLLLEFTGALQIIERRFDARGECSGETEWRIAAGDWL